MVIMTISSDTLTLEVQGLDKLWALKTRIDIPLRHIRGVEVDPEAASQPQGWREQGTHIPGVLTAGTIRHAGKRIFWDVHNPVNAVVINLHDDRYDQLIVEVSDPTATVKQITEALAQAPAISTILS